MLKPEERNKVIDLLVRQECNVIQNNMYSYGASVSPTLQNLLRNGFKGFGSFDDTHLMRCLKKLSTGSDGLAWEAKTILDGIVESIILE